MIKCWNIVIMTKFLFKDLYQIIILLVHRSISTLTLYIRNSCRRDLMCRKLQTVETSWVFKIVTINWENTHLFGINITFKSNTHTYTHTKVFYSVSNHLIKTRTRTERSWLSLTHSQDSQVSATAVSFQYTLFFFYQ